MVSKKQASVVSSLLAAVVAHWALSMHVGSINNNPEWHQQVSLTWPAV